MFLWTSIEVGTCYRLRDELVVWLWLP